MLGKLNRNRPPLPLREGEVSPDSPKIRPRPIVAGHVVTAHISTPDGIVEQRLTVTAEGKVPRPILSAGSSTLGYSFSEMGLERKRTRFGRP